MFGQWVVIFLMVDLSAKIVDNFDVNSISECNSIEKNPIRYIDLEYLDRLHNYTMIIH